MSFIVSCRKLPPHSENQFGFGILPSKAVTNPDRFDFYMVEWEDAMVEGLCEGEGECEVDEDVRGVLRLERVLSLLGQMLGNLKATQTRIV
uniref:Uncharacterized protein n=1 Tax=Tanacetum cinerariifolium TaxID=118510 RepID=A0A6L2L029_TANCI|nr:hypothetical protein [Tanacetum cinerariifolium]